MATYAENLETARDQIAALIVELTADPNPDYTVGNRTINKGTYLNQLNQQLAQLNQQLQTGDGPWELTTRVA